ncbi:MAG: acyltransferase [Ignavibacteriae bacterium]|nr:acyltransferase [Ignavibacteriota bacterium]
MKLAVVQTNPTFGEKSKNIAEALQLMQSTQADLYVLPELFATGYNFATVEEVQHLAEPFRTGVTFKELEQFAHEQRSYVVYGFAEKSNGKLYNSAGIIGHDGTVGLYRKIHLFDREKLFFAPGDKPFQVFDTPHGKVGIMVCFDWYFPESARTLALKGAQLIAHPSNLVLPNCPNSMPTRCLENRVFAATANRIGTENRGVAPLTYIGQSQITSPRGEILHRAPADKPEIAVKDVDLTVTDNKNVTPRNHLLDDRRPEFYA